MTIKVGDRIPSVTLMKMGPDGPGPISTDDIFTGKKVAFFGVPGAFTPTCSAKHVPGFVMGAWAKDQNTGDTVEMVADGDAAFTKAAGLELDLTGKGLGLRNERFSMLVDDGVVKVLNIDPAGAFETTSAEALLKQI